MLTIRFLRIGKKHQPFYRIVVTDKKNPPQGGRFVEILGFYNPFTKEKEIKTERINYWMSEGAEISNSVFNLLVREGILEGDKKKVVAISRKRQTKIDEKLQEQQEKEKAAAEASQVVEEKPVEEKKEEAQPAEAVEEKTEEKTEQTQEEIKTEEKVEEPVQESTEEKTEEVKEEKPVEEKKEEETEKVEESK